MASEDVVLSIVIVNWNGGQVLLDCLDSIFAHPPVFPFEVIVFDNGSQDGSPDRLETLFPQVYVSRSSKNLGFSGGNNRAFEISRGRYLLLLNNDTLILKDALSVMVAEIERDPHVGVLGPRMLNPDGSLQPSAGIFPNLMTEFLDQTMLYRFIPIFKLGNWDYTQPRDVDWLTGACLMIRREVYKQVGGLDPGYFMFLEDVDWCLRIWQSGWRVRFTPAASIIHLKGHSSQAILSRMLIEDQRSTYRFVRKHFGKANVWGFRLIASLGVILRSFFWGGRAILGLNQDQAFNRLKAYIEIFRRSWFDRSFVWGDTD